MEEATEQEAAQVLQVENTKLRELMTWTIFVAAVATVLLSMYNVWTMIGLITGPLIHLGLTTFIISMAFIRRNPTKVRLVWIVIVQLAAWGALLYIYTAQHEILAKLGFASGPQVVFMMLLMIVTFYYSWIMFGPVFAVTAGLFAFYTYTGNASWLPDVLRTADTTFGRATSLLAFQAVGGTIINFSFSFLFMLLIMGSILQSSGGIGFVWTISRGITKRVSGGPGLVAVLSSSTVATFTGGGAANAGITGVVTIPMMKRAGYTSEKAAAIEAVASVAGGITPPILGAAAFIMADFVGKTYFDIIIITAIPAVLFYLGLATYIVFSAQRDQIVMEVESEIPVIPRQAFLMQMTQLVIPMGVLIYLLVQRLSIQLAVFWTLIVTLGLWAFFYLLSRAGIVQAQEEWKNARRNVVQAAILASGIAMAAATLDVMLSAITQTGLGLRVASQMADWGQGSLVLTLFIAIVASYFLGLGLPPLPVYVITAVLLAPALVRLDAEMIVAHYVMYYTALVFPNINPPVASTVLVTGQMAGANYLKASIEATKFAGGAMYLPFLLFFGPELLLVDGFSSTFFHIFALTAVTIVIGQAGLAGYFIVRHNWPIRIIGMTTPIWTFTYLSTRDPLWEIMAIAAVAVVVLYGLVSRRFAKKA